MYVLRETFSQFKWNVVFGRGWWVMHNGIPCGPIQGQGQGHVTHVALKVRNSSIFKIYLVCLIIKNTSRRPQCRRITYYERVWWQSSRSHSHHVHSACQCEQCCRRPCRCRLNRHTVGTSPLHYQQTSTYKHTHSETHTSTHKHTHSETHRQAHAQWDTQKHTHSKTYTLAHTSTFTVRHTDKHTHSETHRSTPTVRHTH